MANKVDVFTEELSKVFTILQQQYVMIKYMKTLITSGELDETEIDKLKEQITLINTNIDTMMNDQIVPIKQNIERIEQGMNEFDKVMPTDINSDINGNLFLEHDGIEITGQKKQVAVYTKSQINTLLNSAGLKTFTLKNKDDYYYNTGINSNKITVTTTDINILNDCAEYVRDNGACILEFDYINRETTHDSPIRILMLYALNGGYGHIVFHGTTGDCEVNGSAIRSTSAQSSENEIIINVLAKKSQIKDYRVYRHQLTLRYDGEYENLSLIVYSSNNLNVDSLQDLTTLLKPDGNTLYYVNTIDSLTVYTYKLIYANNVWKTGPISESTGKPENNITLINDRVTPI